MCRYCIQLTALGLCLTLLGCATPKLKLFADETDPLKEYTLQGKAREKVLLVPISGVISDRPRKAFFRPKPSMVQDVMSQLQRAEKDKQIRAVILKVDSPGGTATASDILYHEIMNFKQRSKIAVVAAMMDMATSGGYYLSLAADAIVAHPTTTTGSVGVIFLRPKVTGLMKKIGIAVEVNKSGKKQRHGISLSKDLS